MKERRKEGMEGVERGRERARAREGKGYSRQSYSLCFKSKAMET